MYIDDIQDYFETLCIEHTDVAHTTTAGGRRAFFKLQSMGEMQQLPNNAGDTLVIIERFTGRAVGEYDANKLRQFVTIRFAKLLELPANGDHEAAVATCMDEVYLLMLDFVSRMRFDFTADSCAWLKYVDFSGISWAEFQGPVIERHYGWNLDIPFIAPMPTYRAGKWVIP